MLATRREGETAKGQLVPQSLVTVVGAHGCPPSAFQFALLTRFSFILTSLFYSHLVHIY